MVIQKTTWLLCMGMLDYYDYICGMQPRDDDYIPIGLHAKASKQEIENVKFAWF